METNEIVVADKYYEALIRLKKAGVLLASLHFSGSGDDGFYDDLYVEPEPIRYKQLSKDLKTLKEYLYKIFDAEPRICFNGDGCRGHLAINLDNFSLEICIETPMWVKDVDEHHRLLPASETKAMVTELAELVDGKHDPA